MAMLIGRNPIIEALKAEGRAVRRILIARGARSAGIRELRRLAHDRNVRCELVERARLDRLAGGGNHQGVIAFADEGPVASLDTLLAETAQVETPIVVLLDHVQDPRNLGAIIRTAEGAGANAVVIPTRGAAGLTPAAIKASTGASEYLPVIRVANLTQTIRRLKEANYWIVGAAGPDVVRSIPYYAYDFRRKIGLVIGSEGMGISRLVAARCDTLVHIPMLGQVESLNASVAAGILLYEARRQQRRKEPPIR